jgi:hypothetical protein
MRKIIQLVVIHVNKYNHFGVLCDDGTLWVRERAKKMEPWNIDETKPPQPDWTWNEIDTSQINSGVQNGI